MAEALANGASSTLNGAITNVATTVVIQTADIGKFPASGTYRIAVTDNTNTELMTVTAGQGTASLTVTRGSEVYAGASTAFAFASGSTVAQVLTNAGLATLIATGGGIGQYRCAARKNSGTAQSNNTTLLHAWDTSVLDTDSMLQVGGAHPNRITFTHAGVYVVFFQVQSTGSGGLQVALQKNYETAATFPPSPDIGGGYIGQPDVWTVQSFAAGDYLSCYSYMGTNSGTVTSRVLAVSL